MYCSVEPIYRWGDNVFVLGFLEHTHTDRIDIASMVNYIDAMSDALYD